MKTKYFLITIFFLAFAMINCNSVDPPTGLTINLKLEDVSCTEAWIELTTTNLQLPTTVTLQQIRPTGDTKSHIFNLITQDSLLYIDSLLPNQTYTFLASHSGLSGISSNELNVTTMDTTSHNFTFETFTFGGTVGSSTLYDVAIINENNIWAVGEILVADTSINGYTMYNAVHWDGSQWNLKKITVTFRGNLITPPLEDVFAFSNIDVWFASSLPIHGDGENWIMYDLRITVDPTITVSKAWGSSSNDMYFVGRNGNITRYLNGNWSRITSGTNLNIQDIWGDYNEKTDEWEILAVSSNVNTSTERTIIKINHFTTQIISSSPIQWSLRTVWFRPSRQYFVAGSGIYAKHILTENEWLNNPLDITTFYTNRIRGNEINDVVGVGAFGDFVHFNGTGWKVNYQDPKLNYGSYLSLDIKENIVAAVGLEYNQAVILIASKINQ
jgi:hypothetical protein